MAIETNKGDMGQLFNFNAPGVRDGDSESGLSDGESSYNSNVVKGVSEGVVKGSELKKRKRNDSDILKYRAVHDSDEVIINIYWFFMNI